MSELLTTEETAKILRTNTNTLGHWRATKQGPTWAKVGRRVVYRRDDVEAFVEAQFAGRINA